MFQTVLWNKNKTSTIVNKSDIWGWPFPSFNFMFQIFYIRNYYNIYIDTYIAVHISGYGYNILTRGGYRVLLSNMYIPIYIVTSTQSILSAVLYSRSAIYALGLVSECFLHG